MDLRLGESWFAAEAGGRAPVYPALDRDRSCDVVVVGAGITGALIAHALVGAGLECVVLDRRQVARGSTAASTSLLQYEIDVQLADLGARIGEADAALAYRLCWESLDELGAIVGGLPDSCGWARRPSLYLAAEPADAGAMPGEAGLRRALGIPVEHLVSEAVGERFGIRSHGALLSADSAVVDSFRLTHALVGEAVRLGASVHAGTRVCAHEPHAAPGRAGSAVVRTEAGPVVRARWVVFATGYEAAALLREPVVRLTSTYALATEPVAAEALWPTRCQIWETARPYFYLRTTEDDRVMIGGLDEPFASPGARDALIAGKSARLMARLGAMFPALGARMDRAWAGTFGETEDGLAYIGPSPERPGALFALCYGGNGMTFATIAARVVTDTVLGRASRGAHLFRFGR
ncbi:MAG TPA: FAD-dependent oxidoreductase [Phycisphaerales bacterium]|nr:FAD-dependent oxidoreductase [Phycisphaerales bacterium]